MQKEIENGVELLELCRRLQSEADGVQRPAYGVPDRTKTCDEFSRQVDSAISNMLLLQKVYPIVERLTELGRKLERGGEISVGLGENYAEAALEHVLLKCTPEADKE